MYIILIVVCAVVVGWVLFGLAFWISQDLKKINNTDNFTSKETIIEPHNINNDTISRQAAIDRATKEHDFYRGAVTVSDKARRDELLNVMCWLGELPSAQPEQLEPDQNGDLWVTVPDIDKVTCIYVQESKSKFCRIFYEER